MPAPALRSALPSMRQLGDFLDEEAAFHKRRRAGQQLVRILLGREDGTDDPVRHPEGRDDPEEYA